jgi:hypothetical protein
MLLKLELSVPFVAFRGGKPLWVIDLGWNTHNPSNNPKFVTNALNGCLEILYILQKRNAAVFQCFPQLLFVLRIVEHNERFWSCNP